MPDSKFTSWVHGTSMQVEYPNRVTSVRPTGPFVRIEGSKGQNTWVHFPIPTPAVVDGVKSSVGAALISFRTRSHAKVHEIIVYDGEERIAEHMDLDVPGAPEVKQGINITVGVQFSSDAPDVRSMQIEIIGAGIEFNGQPD